MFQLIGDTAKHALVFFARQQVEQQAWLSEIVVVFTVIPVIRRAFNRQWRFAKVWLFLEQTRAVWLVSDAVTTVAINAHCAVTMIIMERTFWCVNRNLMMVDAQKIGRASCRERV